MSRRRRSYLIVIKLRAEKGTRVVEVRGGAHGSGESDAGGGALRQVVVWALERGGVRRGEAGTAGAGMAVALPVTDVVADVEVGDGVEAPVLDRRDIVGHRRFLLRCCQVQSCEWKKVNQEEKNFDSFLQKSRHFEVQINSWKM